MTNYYIIFISNLVDTFSRALAGKEFDFTISTSESSLSDSTISKDDFLLVCIDDKVYYQFRVIDKTEEEIRLKKIFEIEKTIGSIIDEEGIIIEIDKKESDSICSKLFDHLVSETVTSVEIQNNPKVLIQNKSLRQFAFDVFKKIHSEFGEQFLEKELTSTSKSDIGGVEYKALKFEKYFSSTKMLATFASEQNKESLTTGKSQRFSEENLKILNKDYVYFNFQWSHPENSSSADFFELKDFIEDWSSSNYKLRFVEIDGKKNYQLILNKTHELQIDFDIKNFQDDCKSAGLVYTDKLITRFVSSLLTKPFVILTGLSGSGKTKLAQAYVQWICQEESQYRIIPVGADWTNREPLLGYPNALKPEEYVKPDSGVIDLILEANSNPELPHFLILDEMNLSHVERYFADFLSVMESNEEIPLYAEGTVDNGVPSKLKLPANLFIIGTVNIDETTNMFSPKVLDRANTIEFRINNNEMKGFLDSASELNMIALLGKGANMAQNFITLSSSKSFTTKDRDEINKTLLNFFAELQKTGAEFGYRSATEILRLINQLDALNNKITTFEKIDIAIMQKLLPKLHGSRRKLSPILETLGSFCLTDDLNVVKDVFEKDDFDYSIDKVLYPLSLEKIARMYKGAIDNGFASYAEA
jgi:5-methylcytosine-specific restriction protein B